MSQFAEIIKFSVSGIFLVAVDMGIYSLLILFMPWFALAKAISFTIGGILAFLINKYWVFKQQQQSPAEIVRFILGNSSALVLNVCINEFLLRMNTNVYVALAAATGVTAIYTFFVFKYWVFTSAPATQ